MSTCIYHLVDVIAFCCFVTFTCWLLNEAEPCGALVCGCHWKVLICFVCFPSRFIDCLINGVCMILKCASTAGRTICNMQIINVEVTKWNNIENLLTNGKKNVTVAKTDTATDWMRQLEALEIISWRCFTLPQWFSHKYRIVHGLGFWYSHTLSIPSSITSVGFQFGNGKRHASTLASSFISMWNLSCSFCI